MTDLMDVARKALSCLDLTNLDEHCTARDIDDLCARAQTEFGPTAAVCIWPKFVAQAKTNLSGTGIRVATVVNFPSGAELLSSVVSMTEQALTDGADEIDMVVPYRRLMGGVRGGIEHDVAAVKGVCGTACLKTILETGELEERGLIHRASVEALNGGADFLKTSTGKVSVNATPQAAQILLEAIRDCGCAVGLKPAGGVRTVFDAGVYLDMCSGIMGPDWATPDTFRIGASGVLTALLDRLNHRDTQTGAEAEEIVEDQTEY